MPVLKNLRHHRHAQALTQRELADLSGVTQVTIIHAEKGGETRPSTIRKLANALKVKPLDLIGEQED
jgi:transcriptional regulator with XRE-family HTH domain